MSETEIELREQIKVLTESLEKANEKIKILEKRVREAEGNQDWIEG